MTPIPLEHLYAELVAFPLASELAFLSRQTTLQASIEGETASLWRALEQEWLPRCGLSVDHLVAVRDRAWFRSDGVSLEQLLRCYSNDLLEPRGLELHLREQRELGEGIGEHTWAAWRWATLALPEDLLVAAGSSGAERVRPPPSRAQRKLFDRGFAEPHLHAGAALDFRTFWASTLRALAIDELQEKQFESRGAPFNDGSIFGRWLLVGAIARATLADYLSDRLRGEDLRSFVRRVNDVSDRRPILEALEALATPACRDPGESFAGLRELYRRLVLRLNPHGYQSSLRSFHELHEHCDPIALRFAPSAGTTPELLWIRTMLCEQNPEVQVLFWQVQRLRVMLYRYVTQRPDVPGLQWFVRFYDRLAPLRKPVRSVIAESAVAVDCDGQSLHSGLQALELRTKPDDTPLALRADLCRFLRSWRRVGDSKGEFGLVFHFARERDPKKGWLKGNPPARWAGTHAEPAWREGSEVGQSHRYARYFADCRRQAFSLATVLEELPELLWFVRGVDVATDEFGIPNWVIAPLFRQLRAAADRAQRATDPAWGTPPEPLRCTAHCGEDFVHLLGGQRQVHESLDWLGFSTGDRLGHALALGYEPERWLRQHPTVVMYCEDRLWDLVWEWDACTGHALQASPGRLEFIRRRIAVLSQQVFGEELSPERLARLRRALPGVWDDDLQLRFDPQRPPPPASDDALLWRFLSDAELFARAHRTISINVKEEGDVAAMELLGEWLRREVCCRGLVVEVNPSSNLLIGDLRDAATHPLMRLDPPFPVEDGAPQPCVAVGVASKLERYANTALDFLAINLCGHRRATQPRPCTVTKRRPSTDARVPIVLGSDDPLTFATSLPQEYELMRRVLHGIDPDSVTGEAWLDRVRENSLAARFTLQPPAGLLEALLHRLEWV